MSADQPTQSPNDKLFAGFQMVDEQAEKVAAVQPDLRERVDHRNGWFQPGEFEAQVQDEINERSAQLLFNVMLYCTDGIKFDTYRGIFRCAVRFLCIIWVLAPNLLRTKKDEIATLNNMAKGLGLSRCWLSMVAEDVSDCFGFISRNQKPLASRENYAKATREAWAIRKAKMNAKKKKTQPVASLKSKSKDKHAPPKPMKKAASKRKVATKPSKVIKTRRIDKRSHK